MRLAALLWLYLVCQELQRHQPNNADRLFPMKSKVERTKKMSTACQELQKLPTNVNGLFPMRSKDEKRAFRHFWLVKTYKLSSQTMRLAFYFSNELLIFIKVLLDQSRNQDFYHFWFIEIFYHIWFVESYKTQKRHGLTCVCNASLSVNVFYCCYSQGGGRRRPWPDLCRQCTF